jgi:hypothetical protein
MRDDFHPEQKTLVIDVEGVLVTMIEIKKAAELIEIQN